MSQLEVLGLNSQLGACRTQGTQSQWLSLTLGPWFSRSFHQRSTLVIRLQHFGSDCLERSRFPSISSARSALCSKQSLPVISFRGLCSMLTVVSLNPVKVVGR